jgi:DNA-binding response OmpR family regulator/AraC-like DNA-binding protein
LLAVHDDRDLLGYFEDALGDEFDVVTAADGSAALDLAQRRCIDVVLLDIVLPGMDGLEVLRRLRMSDAPPEVIVLSGIENARLAVTAMQYGAAEYVTKPFDGSALRAMILEACERRRQPRRRQPSAPAVVASTRGDAKAAVLVAGTDIGGLVPVAIALAGQVVTRLACNAQLALALFAELTPGLVVIEPSLPHTEWISLLRTIHVSARPCPVLVKVTTTGPSPFDTPIPEIIVVHPRNVDELLERIGSLYGGRAGSLCLPRYRPAVLRAIRSMSGNYAASLGVADIARASGLSSRQLAEVFRADTGLTLMDYLTRVRVEVARCFLAANDSRLEDVAQRSGFSDSSHLSRVFMQQFGQRPGYYRRALARRGCRDETRE